MHILRRTTDRGHSLLQFPCFHYITQGTKASPQLPIVYLETDIDELITQILCTLFAGVAAESYRYSSFSYPAECLDGTRGLFLIDVQSPG